MLEEVSGKQIFGNEQPTELEVSLAEFDKAVEQRKALMRLLDNEDFKAIVVEGYLEDDYHRLSDLLKNTSVNKRVVEDRQIIVDKIVAKGYLDNWLESLVKTTAGIDNPETRVELVKQLEAMEAEQEALDE